MLTAAAPPSLADEPNAILEPAQLWAFDGFALQPPDGEGWVSLSRTRARATFGKLTESWTHTVVATANAGAVAERLDSRAALREYLRERRARVPDDPRLRVTGFEAKEEAGVSPCVGYRLEADDARAPDTPLVVRVRGRACVHPQAPGLLIELSASERGRARELDTPTADSLERFLAGLRFLPVSTAALAAVDRLLGAGAAADAARALEPLVAAGDPAAAVRLARLYETGRGVPADRARAERLYRLAAESGEVDALYNLGVFFEQAAGGRRDMVEAVRWLRRAADQRDAQAQLNLGLLYFKGDGVVRDHTQARRWLEAAAGNGSERARDLVRSLRFDRSPWDGLGVPVTPTAIPEAP